MLCQLLVDGALELPADISGKRAQSAYDPTNLCWLQEERDFAGSVISSADWRWAHCEAR